ncbi:MAG: hypothetical protein AAGE84_30030 [Cyanobacteria bacterium P01_G01_bin.39]
MKDKDFYGGGEHPEAGAELVYINGKWLACHRHLPLRGAKPEVPPSEKERHDTYDIYHPKYSEKVKNETQKKIEKKTVNNVGFSKGKKTTDIFPEDHDPVEAKKQRLVLLQSEEARLVKQLESIRKVIKIVKESI